MSYNGFTQQFSLLSSFEVANHFLRGKSITLFKNNVKRWCYIFQFKDQ